VVERAAEAPKVEETFGRPVEHDAHAVEEIDDARRRRRHRFDRRLIAEEVAAVDRVVEVDERRIALALRVHGPVDAALRAHRVRTLDGDDGEEEDLAALFGDADRGHEARQPAADDDDARFGHGCDPIRGRRESW
jgi:hypothetical protein